VQIRWLRKTQRRSRKGKSRKVDHSGSSSCMDTTAAGHLTASQPEAQVSRLAFSDPSPEHKVAHVGSLPLSQAGTLPTNLGSPRTLARG
jgi:hypothetical protein